MASSTRKRALSVDGGDVNAGGRSGERPGKMSRRRRITIAAATTADNIDTDKQGEILQHKVQNLKGKENHVGACLMAYIIEHPNQKCRVIFHTLIYCSVIICDVLLPLSEPVKTGGKVKRQAWTAAAMAAFFEGLCEVNLTSSRS